MDTPTNKSFQIYQITVLFSVVFALLGFSYNVWRMEATEQNSNIRTASFEMLLVLASLEQLVYSAHYDGDVIEASPRKGWVKVGLVDDLSVLTSPAIQNQAAALKSVWSAHWMKMAQSRQSTDQIISAIDATRLEIKTVLSALD